MSSGNLSGSDYDMSSRKMYIIYLKCSKCKKIDTNTHVYVSI